jgi:glutamate decarboxylase
LAGEVEQLGPFQVIYDGRMDAGIPALCWKIKDGTDPGFSLFDLADRLRSRGWQVPAYSLPANCQDLVIQRILVRHGVSRDLGSLLINDMKHALEYFKKHPIQTHMAAEETTGFHH